MLVLPLRCYRVSSVSSSLDAQGKHGKRAQFGEWDDILLPSHTVTAVLCETAALRALLACRLIAEVSW